MPRLARLLFLACLGLLVSAVAVRAGSLPVTIRAFTTPLPGQTPFAPPPGSFLDTQTITLDTGTPFYVANFQGLNDWITPDPVTPTRATFFNRDYLFTFTVEVSSLDNSQVALLEYPGNAFANWVQDPQGGVFQPQVGVTLGDPTITGDLNFGTFTIRESREETISAELHTVMKGANVVLPNPENTGVMVRLDVQNVPEPTTVVLGLLGLGSLTVLRRFKRTKSQGEINC
jgi:hypothetical protein